MASKVDQFLNESGGNNFTETAPRPPVPGEENEKESNGGMSEKSSGSHKSQLSHCSGRSVGSNNPATPRKSNIEKPTAYTNQAFDDEMDAPLGFEPEGSANNSPPFTENSTPPYIKWAENIHMLLDDRDGVQLFRTFLEQEGIGTGSIDFWFACQGVKKMPRTEQRTINVIKVINKKYIKSDKLPCLDAETKRSIADLISRSEIQLSIFNTAQEIVEQYMEKNTYPLFINSDLYVQYVSRGGESPKSSNVSSGSNSARPMSSGPLPTLKEDQELQPDDFVVQFAVPEPPKASRTSHSQFSKGQEVFSTTYPYSQKQIPYHISYAPVSAQDSEIQSQSSQDYLTDDTRSLTDSSIDGHSYRESQSRKQQKKYLKAMQKKAYTNKECGPFIPRTDRAPKDRNIAETDPESFAKLLISKLERVRMDREKQERIQMSISKLNQSDVSDTLDKSCASASSRTTTTSIIPLLTSSMIDEENADSILEEHCSRIWESSAQQTPSRSPGRHSPRSKSPDRSRRSLSQPGSSSLPGTLQTKHLHKKRSDIYSLSSVDSGVEDVNKHSVETHKHIHHHHHHHHDRRRSKHKLELQAQQHSMVCWSDNPRPHSGTTRQKPVSGSRNHSDVCSNLDSGISTIESIGQPPDPVQDPTTSKVIQWMLDNENIKRCQSSAYTDSDKTISTKKSHKSAALPPGTPQPYNKQSIPKKGSIGHINRSASADSSYRLPWVPGPGMVGAMPCQPISQDPSMPLMPQPNTMVQLQEVHRRLEADQALKIAPVKSKSFAGVQSKDKRTPIVSSQSANPVRAPVMVPARPAPGELDASWDAGRTDKRTSKRSSGSGDTSSSSRPEETVIGYYLCGEPIPYRITVPQPYVTLGQLKQLISKKGLFRFFVKTHNKDFDSEVVYEEIKEDNKILPVFEGKVVVKVDRIEDDSKVNISLKK